MIATTGMAVPHRGQSRTVDNPTLDKFVNGGTQPVCLLLDCAKDVGRQVKCYRTSPQAGVFHVLHVEILINVLPLIKKPVQLAGINEGTSVRPTIAHIVPLRLPLLCVLR
jgi:hypothetical protein